MFNDDLRTFNNFALALTADGVGQAKGHEIALTALTAMESFEKRWKEMKRKLKDAVIAHINATDAIVCGDIRYYVGPDKKVKCLDAKGVLDALLTKLAGDLDAVTACLSTGAWKPASTIAALGDTAERFFETTIVDELKEGKPTGKPRKSLKKVDTRFLDKEQEVDGE